MMFTFAELTLFRPDIELTALIPLLVLGGLLVCAFLFELKDDDAGRSGIDLTRYRPTIIGFSVLALVGLLGYLYFDPLDGGSRTTFNGMIFDDILTRGAAFLIGLSALMALMAGPDELEREECPRGAEYAGLILGAALGMVMMAASANLIVIFLALELFSISLYLLCIFFPRKHASQESGLKYFLLSSAASAIMLYGMAMLYGATGTTWLTQMSVSLDPADPTSSLSTFAVIGGIFILIGLLFKLAVVPFHSWAPDVYEGAPTTVTAFMSVATKVAALVTLWRIFVTFGAGLPYAQVATLIMFSLAVLSMLLGNLMALGQTSIKRMLAYSGIANAGYLLMAPLGGEALLAPMFLFLTAYLFGTTGAFLAVSLMEAHFGREVTRADLRGFYSVKPWVAVAFAICLVSLAGLPPAAGFMGKFYLFGAVLTEGNAILPAFGILGSLIGMGYYMGAGISLFHGSEVKESPGTAEGPLGSPSQHPTALTLGFCTVSVMAIGVFPWLFFDWLHHIGF